MTPGTKTAVIVQARMASTRLPGKVLLPLGGTTVLDHVLSRCLSIPGADVVCCAIPDTADCDPIAEEAQRIGVQVSRGSEDDVLDRYYRAALAVNADVVLRITSDCPAVDPWVAGKVLALRDHEGADFACNNMPPSWPHGLDCEVVTFAWLERAAKEASKKFEREHVMPYIRNHADVTKVNLEGPGAHTVGHRWTLDNAADYEFFQALWTRLPAGLDGWSFETVLGIVETDPTLAAINAGQDRLEGLKKSMRES